MNIGAMARRLAALERQTAGRGATGAPGVSTAFGVGSTAYRDRFPAILTSTFDTLTGYSWDRLVLARTASATSVDEVDLPQSGSYAFTPDNDETLTAGQRGWLEADPNAGGWFFLAAGGGAGGSACGGSCGSLVGLAADATLRLELVCATGSFADIDPDQFAAVYAFGSGGTWEFQIWDDGAEDWVDFELLTYPAGTPITPVTFTWNSTPFPELVLGTIDITRTCLGSDATFAGGPRNGLEGDPAWVPDGECPSNELVLKVSCSCEVLDGWGGADEEGTPYCVAASSCDDEKACVLLYPGDECAATADFVICSGPYTDMTACEAACDPPAPTAPCQVRDFTGATVAITLKTGDCSCLPDSPATADAGVDTITALTPGCGNEQFTMDCVGGFYAITGSPDMPLVSFSAGPPTVIVFDMGPASFYCGGGVGTARVTITLP